MKTQFEHQSSLLIVQSAQQRPRATYNGGNFFLVGNIEDSKHLSLMRSTKQSSGLDPSNGEKICSYQPQVDQQGEIPQPPSSASICSLFRGRVAGRQEVGPCPP